MNSHLVALTLSLTTGGTQMSVKRHLSLWPNSPVLFAVGGAVVYARLHCNGTPPIASVESARA